MCRVWTSKAEFIYVHGGTLLDATLDLAMWRTVRPDLNVLYAQAPDGCSGIMRTHLYRARAHRTALCPDHKPDWKRVVPLVRLAMEWARDKGHTTLWIETFIDVTAARARVLYARRDRCQGMRSDGSDSFSSECVAAAWAAAAAR